ncbi:hypothetical protein A6302_01585 [Methylobrevis pamukkalensis]|uniref:Uncharacterized protein n=1 Tax=Methylobrevis pamukkalensis TaxID=1439726 RepID=A0A1E3H443_9HYPH|nr:hypothetical protein A6302_01585 [Methylobrevis pamukkalensis]
MAIPGAMPGTCEPGTPCPDRDQWAVIRRSPGNHENVNPVGLHAGGGIPISCVRWRRPRTSAMPPRLGRRLVTSAGVPPSECAFPMAPSAVCPETGRFTFCEPASSSPADVDGPPRRWTGRRGRRIRLARGAAAGQSAASRRDPGIPPLHVRSPVDRHLEHQLGADAPRHRRAADRPPCAGRDLPAGDQMRRRPVSGRRFPQARLRPHRAQRRARRLPRGGDRLALSAR